ncbi:MAG: hydroxymethylbilane synthase, partial [Chloroflexi bacterium]|nr:hydroxymethylbilane synthase [Chloroflexota bacterium]
MVTEGDRTQAANVPLPSIAGRGVFVKELELALLASEADMAVHSLKDVPTELEPGLILAAVTAREDVRDVLVSRDGRRLADLPPGARVGTGSTRRAAQVLAFRPDLTVVPIRGNVDTRLRKVQEGEVDAAVLAAAGIIRLNRQDAITEYLSEEISLPAVGQGAIAVEVRADDAESIALLGAINHAETWTAVMAERAFMRAIGGG